MMEVAQNILFITGQATSNASGQNSSRTGAATPATSDLTAGSTSDSNSQDGNAGTAEFGNLLNFILDTTPVAAAAGDKSNIILTVESQPIFKPAVTLTSAMPVLISQPSEVHNNSAMGPGDLASFNASNVPENLQKPQGSDGHEILQGVQSAILFSNAETDSAEKTEPTTPKPSNPNNGLPESSPYLTSLLNTPLINFPEPSMNQSVSQQSQYPNTPDINETKPLIDKLLNSTGIISTPLTTLDSENSLKPVQDGKHTGAGLLSAPHTGDAKLDDETPAGNGPGKALAPSGIIDSGSPSDMLGAGHAPVAVITQPAMPKLDDETTANTSLGILLTPSQTSDVKPAPSTTISQPALPETNQPASTSSGENMAENNSASEPLPLGQSGISPLPVNPTTSDIAAQIVSAGLLPGSPAVNQAVENKPDAAKQQALLQNKPSIQALDDPGPDTNRSAASQVISSAAPGAQNQIAAQQQPISADGQNFTQTISQNPGGLPAALPESFAPAAGTEVTQDETGNIILLDKQEPLRSAITPSAPREAHSQPVSPPIRDIAIHIAQHADTGINRFQLRLDPPELGRVDVRMEVSAEGKLSAVIAVERPETLDLLQRDSRALERSLMDAGLKTDSNSLSFSLKGGRHDNQNSGASNPGFDNSGNSSMADWDESVAPVVARFANRSVNIRI